MDLHNELEKLKGKTQTVDFGTQVVLQTAMLKAIIVTQANLVAHLQNRNPAEVHAEIWDEISRQIIDDFNVNESSTAVS